VSPALDERPLRFVDLAPFAAQLDADDLIAMLRDGRGVVRANAALGLAAVNQPALDLVMLLRDSEPRVAAAAAAEAIGLLGVLVRPFLPQITQALDGAQAEILDAVVGTLASLVGKANDELRLALDVPFALAMKTIVEACGRLDKAGVALLIAAAGDEKSRVRINAIGGLGRWGKADIDASMACLLAIEANDSMPDVRTAAKQASLAVIARTKVVAVDALPKNIPDFEARKLGGSELAEYEGAINVDEMIYALSDGRTHVRINAARALGVKGEAAGRAGPTLGLACRDSIAQVRREAAKALVKLGGEALPAVPDLVTYLHDGRAHVRANAATALGALGPAAAGVALSIGVLLRDDDMRVRSAAAGALDKLGDDAVRETADYLVGALRGDAEVTKAVAPVVAARKARMLGALLKGLETDDDTHARRILSSSTCWPTPPRSCAMRSRARPRTSRSTRRSASACSAIRAPEPPGARRSRPGARAGSSARARRCSRRSRCGRASATRARRRSTAGTPGRGRAPAPRRSCYVPRTR